MSAPGERRAPRVQRPFMIRYRAREAARAAWGMSPVKDLSTGGTRFVAEEPFVVGQALVMVLALPSAARSLSLEGTVTWVRGAPMGLTEYGVKFQAGDVATRQALEEIVRRFAARSTP